MNDEEKNEHSKEMLRLNAAFHNIYSWNEFPKDLSPKINISKLIEWHEKQKDSSFSIRIKYSQDLLFYDKYISELKANGVRYSVLCILGENDNSYISRWFNHKRCISEQELRTFMKRNGYVYINEIENIEAVSFGVLL